MLDSFLRRIQDLQASLPTKRKNPYEAVWVWLGRTDHSAIGNGAGRSPSHTRTAPWSTARCRGAPRAPPAPARALYSPADPDRPREGWCENDATAAAAEPRAAAGPTDGDARATEAALPEEGSSETMAVVASGLDDGAAVVAALAAGTAALVVEEVVAAERPLLSMTDASLMLASAAAPTEPAVAEVVVVGLAVAVTTGGAAEPTGCAAAAAAAVAVAVAVARADGTTARSTGAC
jgi:hypothetical protein